MMRRASTNTNTIEGKFGFYDVPSVSALCLDIGSI